MQREHYQFSTKPLKNVGTGSELLQIAVLAWNIHSVAAGVKCVVAVS